MCIFKLQEDDHGDFSVAPRVPKSSRGPSSTDVGSERVRVVERSPRTSANTVTRRSPKSSRVEERSPRQSSRYEPSRSSRVIPPPDPPLRIPSPEPTRRIPIGHRRGASSASDIPPEAPQPPPVTRESRSGDVHRSRSSVHRRGSKRSVAVSPASTPPSHKDRHSPAHTEGSRSPGSNVAEASTRRSRSEERRKIEAPAYSPRPWDRSDRLRGPHGSSEEILYEDEGGNVTSNKRYR